MYASNNRVSKYMRQKLIELQGKEDESTIMVRDFYHSIGNGLIKQAEKSVRIQLNSTTPSNNWI